MPDGVRLQVIRDQSRYIHAALHEISVHLVLGSILASLVVLAFMRSWQSTIIAAVAIPASVVSAFGMMWALGFTLNSVTMLALVLMVGIVIDDAIVVLENIFRFIEEKRMNAFEAARAATADIGLAVMATTFSLVVIFLPVSFMSSVSGRFLYQFGVTAAVSVLVSLLVSFTLTPDDERAHDPRGPGRVRGHGQGHEEAASRRGFYAWLDRGYTWTLRLSMRYRWVVIAISLAVIASTWPIYGWVKQEYTPTDVDESEFEATINGPEGISMPAMDEAVRAIGAEVASVPGVRTVLITAGGGFLSRISQGNIYVRTAPHEERTFSLGRLWRGIIHGDPMAAFRGNYAQRDVMQQVRQKLRKFRDFRILVRNIPGFNIGGGSFEIDFVLRGPDLVQLAKYAEELRTRAIAMGGIADPDTTLRLDRPELRVTHRPRARGRPARGHRADRHRAPAHGRRRHRGLALPRPHHQRGLLRPAPPEREGPRRPRDDLAALRLAAGRRNGTEQPGAARQRGSDLAGLHRLPHRPLGPAARGAPARRGAPRLRPGRPHRGAAGRRGGDEAGARLQQRDLRSRQGAREDLHRVPLGVPALGRSSCT